jgi:large subunit ribosomal protein L20
MRIKRGVTTHARHKKLRQQVKGMAHARTSSPRKAREAIYKALSYGYRDRRNKKRDLRSLWITRINAALGEVSYSQFVGGLKKAGIELDRKILSELAVNQPKAFAEVADLAKKST